MKLTEEQINQIIEGLENSNTRLVRNNCDVIKKHNDFMYEMFVDGFMSLWSIDTLRMWLKITNNGSFELVTETRTKI